MSMSTTFKSAAKRLPIIKKLVAERDRLRREHAEVLLERDNLRGEHARIAAEHDNLHREHAEVTAERDNLRREYAGIVAAHDRLNRACGVVPPGHFYSPIPSLEEIERDDAIIFGSISRNFPGIELHESEQLELLESFCPFYQSMPFTPHKTEGLRYYFENPAYSYSDAILLHCMMRHLKPKKIIEIGSGYSSCVTLDTNELFLNGSASITFIDPNSGIVESLIKEEDKSKVRIIPRRLQDVGLNEFETLAANDILFIDSTHVSKVNSDVNYNFFSILPLLSSGVHIHIHDIFFPFEYPRNWIYEGRAWNEIYLLRAFLQYNNKFRVVLMNTFMEHFHESFFREKMPLCLKNPGGSIWLRKE